MAGTTGSLVLPGLAAKRNRKALHRCLHAKQRNRRVFLQRLWKPNFSLGLQIRQRLRMAELYPSYPSRGHRSAHGLQPLYDSRRDPLCFLWRSLGPPLPRWTIGQRRHPVLHQFGKYGVWKVEARHEKRDFRLHLLLLGSWFLSLVSFLLHFPNTTLSLPTKWNQTQLFLFFLCQHRYTTCCIISIIPLERKIITPTPVRLMIGIRPVTTPSFN